MTRGDVYVKMKCIEAETHLMPVEKLKVITEYIIYR